MPQTVTGWARRWMATNWVWFWVWFWVWLK